MNQKLATSEKYSLTIKEAADYFGIGIKRMRRLAEDHLGTFSAYLKKTPIMPSTKGEELKRAQLEDKSIFNPEEAIVFYDLSRRKFKKLLEGEEELPFVAFFKTRKIIIRDEFEDYMEDHPEIMEELKNGKARVS